jgi:predicted component of type VI protein secretion system
VLAEAPRIAKAVLPEPPSVILGPHHTAEGTSVDTADAWTSAHAFQRNVRRYGDNPAYRHFTSVVYDPERWDATPLAEQRDPAASYALFSRVARSRGWAVIITPHPSLTSVPGAACGTNDGESEFDAFLRCDLTGQAARFADVVEVQAQSLQTQPDDYRAFVLEAAAHARLANPNVKVIAGLTTGPETSADQMYAAWDAVRDLVDGYYLSISSEERVPIALAFLRMIRAQQT